MSVPDRDPYEVVIELIRQLEGRVERGFADVKEQLRDIRNDRTQCRADHEKRIASLEHWKAGLTAIYAAVSAIVSAIVSLLLAHWGAHK